MSAGIGHTLTGSALGNRTESLRDLSITLNGEFALTVKWF
mgnify:CR=1 FL=1